MSAEESVDASSGQETDTAHAKEDLALPWLPPESVILLILRLSGPRHARSSLGSVSKLLRRLSSSDVLWSEFWSDRCRPDVLHSGGRLWRSADRPTDGILAAYTELHARRPPVPTEEVVVYPGPTHETRPISCSYEWRGRLTPADETEICGAEATLWCDYPDCGTSRCRRNCPQGRWDDDAVVDFFRCSFCAASACESHAQSERWRFCEECKAVSCPHCEGHVLVGHTVPCGYCSSWKVRCPKKVCAKCAMVVVKIGPMEIETAPATRDQVAAKAASTNEDEDDGDGDECTLCCRECTKEYENDMAEMRQRHAELEEDRLEQLERLAPCPRTTRRCRGGRGPGKAYAWAFGSFDTVDTEGQRGHLCFGLNKVGDASGILKFPKRDMTQESEYKYGKFDTVGLGPAWYEHTPEAEWYQPRIVNDDCIEVTCTVAPGPLYTFRGYCNQGYEGQLRVEKVKKDGQILLKCMFQVEEPSIRCQIFFSAAPIALGGQVTSLHDAAEVEAARAKFSNAHAAKKKKRRRRMERLIRKYPNAGIEYGPGQSSDSEVDNLRDSDMIPPWARSER